MTMFSEEMMERLRRHAGQKELRDIPIIVLSSKRGNGIH